MCLTFTVGWLEIKETIMDNVGYYCSVTKESLTLCNPMDCSTQAFLSFTVSCGVLKLMSIKLVMPSNHPPSVIPFSSCPQSFPASGSLPMNRFFTSGGQSIEVSASASVLPMNIQGSFPLGLTGLISLQSKGLLRVFSAPQFKSISSSVLNFLYGLTHISP